MVFAAGLGTRLQPLTNTMPKALVPVGGKPLLWHVLNKLCAAGYERVVVNVHHFAQQIIDYLEENRNFGLDIRISDETDRLLETGGGIKKALPLFDTSEPVLIHNVDILSNADFSHGDCSRPDAVLLVSQRQTKRYLLFDDGMRLRGWTNIETGEVRDHRGTVPVCPAGSAHGGQPPRDLRQLAFSGIHVLSPSAFPLLDAMPECFPIMDFYLKYCQQLTFIGHEQRDLRLLDVGKLDSLELAEKFIVDNT